ncbi:calcineurin-like phosphoesterase family protein [Sphaerotilus hippei]|uniref:Calcineurin-like phosphoesterase family protein n=1 Tax=Sphaerotilus hippei TaxID=744406 RepID=A0A318H5Z4_9BURK|nr:metallophosphoesterase [Sphaerotilus hippei]PXW99394.1 calcineurin-like phosphoesterase family protein [Sphaerotilus hippei]
MRLQLLSDLHLESSPGFVARPAPGVDLLVLAGDIGSYQPGSALMNEADFGLGRFSPLRPGAGWKRVLYVPGNHEYDALEHGVTRLRLRSACERLGIVWLDEQVVRIDGVRFIGSTLWTDFDALASAAALQLKAQGLVGGTLSGQPSRKTVRRELRAAQTAAVDPTSELTRQLRERDKAFRAANFYLGKNTTLQADGRPMLAEDLRELGLRAQAWLRTALATPHPDGPTVVVTHFAPSLRSADPRYGLVPGTAGFCNALDELLPLADLWLHGHLHCPVDYVAEGPRPDGSTGRCRVVANPLGYAGKGEQARFEATQVIEVPGAPCIRGR